MRQHQKMKVFAIASSAFFGASLAKDVRSDIRIFDKNELACVPVEGQVKHLVEAQIDLAVNHVISEISGLSRVGGDIELMNCSGSFGARVLIHEDIEVIPMTSARFLKVYFRKRDAFDDALGLKWPTEILLLEIGE